MSRPRRQRVGPPGLAPASAAVILAVVLVACGDDGTPAAAPPTGPVATDQIVAAGTYDRHARVTGRFRWP
ncbi:MAG: hypothetical protein ACFCVG_08560 [Kineosporiaceae bacterium]